MNEQTHTTEETISNKETQQEVNTNISTEQTTSETGGSASGTEKPEQVDNFAQMYDMLTERDKTIKELTSEVAELKRTNTSLLLKVNASASAGGDLKNPYESFVDSMAKR